MNQERRLERGGVRVCARLARAEHSRRRISAVTSSRFSDTPDDIRERQFEILRAMTPQERLELARMLTLNVQQLAFAGMRARFPEAPDDEIWLRLAARRLGRDVVLKVYGFDAGEE
jgi:hypothetical protein